jgi:DNA-directed RNA polymerase sigma subunit (sigma70/sigma32)
MFIEIVGDSALLDQLGLDRDDVKEAITDALDKDGQVTGAGTGIPSAGHPRWNLDVEFKPNTVEGTTIVRLARALTRIGLETVITAAKASTLDRRATSQDRSRSARRSLTPSNLRTTVEVWTSSGDGGTEDKDCLGRRDIWLRRHTAWEVEAGPDPF